jgi:hypothetical protein
MATTEVRGGRPVLVRTGGPELAAEAAVLAAVAGPGVPEVVEAGEGLLVTTVAPPVPPPAMVGVAAELAAVLARAHAAGIVHGPIHDEHVQGAPGAVLLAGWEAAGPGDPAADVAELGRLLERHGGDPAIVARALAPDPPTMAALLDALAPPPPAPRQLLPRPGAATPDERRRVPTAALAALVVVLAVVAVALVLERGGDARPSEPAAAVERSTTTTTTAAPTTTTSTVPVRIDGNVLERAGARWSVGRPGDLVLVGDWDCDGEPTPAVVRPSTGEVWLFDGWSGDGQPEAGQPAGAVGSARTAEVDRSDGCDRLVVRSADGQSTTVG